MDVVRCTFFLLRSSSRPKRRPLAASILAASSHKSSSKQLFPLLKNLCIAITGFGWFPNRKIIKVAQKTSFLCLLKDFQTLKNAVFASMSWANDLDQFVIFEKSKARSLVTIWKTASSSQDRSRAATERERRKCCCGWASQNIYYYCWARVASICHHRGVYPLLLYLRDVILYLNEKATSFPWAAVMLTKESLCLQWPCRTFISLCITYIIRHKNSFM